ncbi:MAG: hypothetical protein Q4D41_11805 [Prevotellaceae bacterium]|nr:hypothetical protein [Prevotellaceae bacterium]
MRKINFNWLLLMLSIFILTACSESKTSKLLKQVPVSSEYVSLVNAKTLIESAGGSMTDSKSILPPAITDMMPSSSKSDLEDINKILSDVGIDSEACVIFGNYESDSPIIVVSLSDEDKFIKMITEEGYKAESKADDVAFYTKVTEYGYKTIAITKSFAYCALKPAKQSAVSKLKNIITDAANDSYASTEFGKYISKGNAGGIALKIPPQTQQQLIAAGAAPSMVTLYKGVVCIYGNLTEDAMEINTKLLNEDGSEKDLAAFKDMFDVNAKINKKALAYMGSNDLLIMAVSLKNVDWDKYMETVLQGNALSRSDKATLTIAKSHFEKLDGTVAIGLGITNGLESIFNMDIGNDFMNQFSMTLVAETKEGKAKGLVNELKAFLEKGNIPYTSTESGLSVELPDKAGTFYVENTDDLLVFANHKITNKNDNATVDGIDFSNYLSACGLVINKDNKLLKDLNIQNDIKASITGDANNIDGSFKMEIKGGEAKGFLAKLIGIVTNISNQEKALDRKLREHRKKVYGY